MKMSSGAPAYRRVIQATVGGFGALVMVVGAVVVFGGIGQGGSNGDTPGAATVAASPTPAAVVNVQTGNITILNAVVKTTGNDVASLYFTVRNAGPADTLIDESTDASTNTELFDTVEKDGLSTMPQVESIAIPANGEVEVSPGGYHVMINDITNPLQVGEHVQVTLTFANAGKVEFHAPVTGY